MMAMDKSLLGALSMSEQLESAIERDEFELYYQPLMDVRDGSTYGVEALIRWNHPERGLLEPAEFVR
jgi:EAL domain-containing protein (putative c-di-GMP-specific phosphodiesterase class I)